MLHFLKTIKFVLSLMWEIATLTGEEKRRYSSEMDKVIAVARRNLETIEQDKIEIEKLKQRTLMLLKQAQEMVEQNKRITSSLPTEKSKPDALPLDP